MCPLRSILFATLLYLAVYSRTVSGAVCTSNICTYDFDIRHQKTMTYTTIDASLNRSVTFDVELSGTRLLVKPNTFYSQQDIERVLGANGLEVLPSDVITADGFPRYVITVNKQFPGPTIEVVQGAEIVVHVVNHLHYQATAIHWHGIEQFDTPYMDGAAYITQCPIPARSKFTYHFKAPQAGSFWYHAHVDSQRMDGLFGMIIVHSATQPVTPSFAVMISDWGHRDALSFDMERPEVAGPMKVNPGAGNGYTRHPFYMTDDGNALQLVQYDAGLINGRGRYNNNAAPLAEFVVTAGQQYRFRLTHAGFHHTMVVEIDEHELDIVALDGNDIERIRVNSFHITPGERVDFLFTARSDVRTYWIRARSLATNVAVPEALAILRYSGATAGDPTTTPTDCRLKLGGCVAFNCPFAAFPPDKRTQCVSLTSATSVLAAPPASTFYQHRYGLDKEVPDVEYILNLVPSKNPQLPGMAVNGIVNVETSTLLYGQTSTVNPKIARCTSLSCVEGCECANIISIQPNKTIQFVVTNYALPEDVHPPHGFHMHGHHFAVVKMGFQPLNTSSGVAIGYNADIECADAQCVTTRWTAGAPLMNLINPPLKDTVLLPVKGYVVVRIRTDNPGVWSVHCHMENHMMQGMAFTINEAEYLQPELPNNFPMCVDFM